ncbi:MAG: DUF4912 domain-containing protein, partial [Verrucomicrobiota bacterium]
MKSPNETISTPAASDFRLSDPPLETARSVDDNQGEAGNFRLLPRSYGTPVVCALVRNPTSLFVYWEIDWPAFFARTAPRNRQVHLRLQKADGTEISKSVIEPMAGHCEVAVPDSNSGYRVELGYFGLDDAWNSAGSANAVSTPPDALSEPAAATFATVPFHLSFQRLTDLFHASTSGGGAVIEQLGRLQEKALMSEGGESLTSGEEEILRALEASLPNGWQDAARNPGREIDLDQRLEEILGFGSSSPAASFGGSS